MISSLILKKQNINSIVIKSLWLFKSIFKILNFTENVKNLQNIGMIQWSWNSAFPYIKFIRISWVDNLEAFSISISMVEKMCMYIYVRPVQNTYSHIISKIEALGEENTTYKKHCVSCSKMMPEPVPTVLLY